MIHSEEKYHIEADLSRLDPKVDKVVVSVCRRRKALEMQKKAREEFYNAQEQSYDPNL